MNPQLRARLEAMLPAGMSLEQAAEGFRNQGQFIAALQQSNNHDLSFVDLKAEMTGDNPVSLGQAMRKLGAKTVVVLLLPDPEVAFKILALNTEKAHNLKEKSLETIRMLRALADERSAATEREFAFEFDQAPFLTLGAAYEQRPRLSGGAYNPVLRRIDDFLDVRLPQALKERSRRAGLILKIDDGVTDIVNKLKKRGFTSPYLRPFVVARINPIRFSTSTEFDVDEVLSRMQKNADKFNVEKVRQEDVVRAGRGPAEEES